ncbi:MAG: tetratricopeptide repeat protein, partial [Chloroflexota bacterium]
QPDLALKEIEISRNILKKTRPEDPVNLRDLYAYILAKDGKIKEANEVLQALKKDVEGKNKTGMDNYWRALGVVDLIKGDSKSAVTYLEKGVKEAPSPLLEARYYLAQAYLESGKIGEAVTELEKALLRYDENRAAYAIWSVKAYYLLGLAYEKSGWNNKAIDSYETFLDIWKGADPGIPEVTDAKERVKKLRVGT